MNSLKDIQSRLNNGFVLVYLKDEFIQEHKSWLLKDTYIYDMMDFMSFDPRESTYLSNIINSDLDIGLLANYSLWLMPTEQYLNSIYFDSSISLFDNSNYIVDIINKFIKEYQNDENTYNFISNLYSLVNSYRIDKYEYNIISLNWLISIYNNKNEWNLLKKLLANNSDDILINTTIIRFFYNFILWLYNNKLLTFQNISSIIFIIKYFKSSSIHKLEQNNKEMYKYYNQQIYKLIENTYVLFSLQELDLKNDDHNRNIIWQIIDTVLVINSGYSNNRLRDDSYFDLLDILQNYQFLLRKIYELYKKD